MLRRRTALFLRGLRYRRGVALLLVLVAALATGTGAAAASYRDASALSALRARLAGAAPAVVKVAAVAWLRPGPR